MKICVIKEQRAQHDYKIILPSIGLEGLKNQRNRAVTRTRSVRNMDFGSDQALEPTQWQKRVHEVNVIGLRKFDYLP